MAAVRVGHPVIRFAQPSVENFHPRRWKDDEMLPDYDFSGGTRGKHYQVPNFKPAQ